MQPIGDIKQKRITYNKRKRGILKKAIELSALCETEIFLVVLDRRNKTMVEFNSSREFNLKTVSKLDKKQYQYDFFLNDDYRALENCISENQFVRAHTAYRNSEQNKKGKSPFDFKKLLGDKNKKCENDEDDPEVMSFIENVLMKKKQQQTEFLVPRKMQT